MQFGPFAIDTVRWELTRDGIPVALSPRLVEILAHLVANRGQVVTRNALLERFWPDVYITENTLTRAVADIRKALDDTTSAPMYIQTVARRGYRFIVRGTSGIAPLSTFSSVVSSGGTAIVTDPFLLWVAGKQSLESLDVRRLPDALAAFESAVQTMPAYAPAHVGLANACFLVFEHTRADPEPDRASLVRAIEHARRATELDAGLGEAWGTLGHVLSSAGHIEEARAAARQAAALEPTSWWHHFRLATATWGDERLRAVERTLALMPDFAPAHLLAATVFIARHALGPAERVAQLGAVAQARHSTRDVAPFPAVGSHWLLGLLQLARHDVEHAVRSFTSELEDASDALVYGHEFAVNALASLGYAHLIGGDPPRAEEAFREAVERSPQHSRSVLGLAVARERQGHSGAVQAGTPQLMQIVEGLHAAGRATDAAMALGGLYAITGRRAHAIETLDQILAGPLSQAGWLIPIEPMFASLRDTPEFDRLLARLAARAA